MPSDSRRIYATHRLRVSKIVDAPSTYVYNWFTDYRDDDGQFSSRRPGYRTMRLSRDRVLRIRSTPGKGRALAIAVDVVRLLPPTRWHVDQIDETDLATVDYRVVRLGRRRSRVELAIVERWMTPEHPSREEYLRNTNSYWDRLVAALEDSYRRGHPARG